MSIRSKYLLFAGACTVVLCSGAVLLISSHSNGTISDDKRIITREHSSPAPTAQPIDVPKVPALRLSIGVASSCSRTQKLIAENQRLTILNDKLESQLTDFLNWVLVNFQGKHPLPLEQLKKLKLTAVASDFCLHPEVAEFLNITAEEQSMINDVFGYTEKLLREIEWDNLSVTAPSASKHILYIPTFYEEGTALREDLYAALETTLGGPRFDRLIDVSQSDLETSFHHFGDAAHTIVFEARYVENDDTPYLYIKDGWITDSANGQRVISAVESSTTALPEQYTQYAEFLPDELQATANAAD